MMLDDIYEIEIIPPNFKEKNVSERLRELINSAHVFQAAIAFWSISPDKLFPPIFSDVYRLLAKEDCFVCVDLQRPTNIDNLAMMVNRGSNIYLNTTRLHRSKESTSSSSALLHTKLILSDMVNGDAELWIGSHNWTEAALFGTNLEATIIVRLSRSSQLYSQVRSYLESIRKMCEPFNTEKIEIYKLWQNFESREQKSNHIIELEGRDLSDLIGHTIVIFGTENDDYDAMKTVKDKILLSIFDTDNESQRYLYEARISQTGELISADPATTEIEFREEQRFAFKRGKNFPVLNKPQKIEMEVLNRAFFFTTLIIQKLKANKYTLNDPIPKQTYWIDQKDRRWTKGDFLQKREFFDLNSIMVPLESAQIVKIDSREMNLAEKRTDKSHNLVVRKCVAIIK